MRVKAQRGATAHGLILVDLCQFVSISDDSHTATLSRRLCSLRLQLASSNPSLLHFHCRPVRSVSAPCLPRVRHGQSVAELILLEALFPRVPLRPAAPPSAPPLLPGTAAGLAAAGEGAVRLLASVNDALLPTFLVANLLTVRAA